jgi:excisionase family DNA binding protein
MLNTQEVCCVLRVTEQTVRSMIRDGRLNAIKVGRGWRVERDALKRYVEGGGAA